jgi:hypothetical protein
VREQSANERAPLCSACDDRIGRDGSMTTTVRNPKGQSFLEQGDAG